MNIDSKKTKRFTAILLAAIVLFAVMSAVFFIGAEAEHDCSGDDCLICYQISSCSSILKSFGSVAFFVTAVLCLMLLSASLFGNTADYFINNTLVSLNIKITD